MEQPLITINNLSKSFADHAALLPMQLSVANGEFLTLLGPSGCGKTTLLRMLAGFETPDQGRIVLNGQDITDHSPEHRHINMVFQNYALFPHMTVYENIAFGLRCQKLAAGEIEQRVNELARRVGLEKLLQRKPRQLSGGQQQRVAIARAVINEPLVVLLDEPFSALDYHLRKRTRIEMKALQRKLGITFILVTHDQEEALSISDRIVIMNEGRIEQVGTPRDVYEEPNSMYVAQFIGEANIFKTQVYALDQQRIEVELAGHRVWLKAPQAYALGDKVNVILRPEDIEVWGINEVEDIGDRFHAVVDEVIYKGSTVDLWVMLENGVRLFATEFFDEDDPNLEYEIGEPVLILWKHGWEVVLPNED